MEAEVPAEERPGGSGEFAIGGELWPGLGKLAEECGELVQVIGKLMGSRGASEHWDGSDLTVRMHEEIADVDAAIRFTLAVNGQLDRSAVEARAQRKLELFHSWHSSGNS